MKGLVGYYRYQDQVYLVTENVGLCHIYKLPFGVCGKSAGRQDGAILYPLVCIGGNYDLLPATSAWQTSWDCFSLDSITLYGKGEGILQM